MAESKELCEQCYFKGKDLFVSNIFIQSSGAAFRAFLKRYYTLKSLTHSVEIIRPTLPLSLGMRNTPDVTHDWGITTLRLSVKKGNFSQLLTSFGDVSERRRRAPSSLRFALNLMSALGRGFLLLLNDF